MPGELSEPKHSNAVAVAAWHSLLWLVIANLIGVMLAILLLVPGLNPLLGEWTYGRWIMVHMNLELYGWTALPLIGFLFKVYGADRGTAAKWCRPMLWAWSMALTAGSLSWLSGHSSGKLFLDWTGYVRVLFPASIFALWVLLALSFLLRWNTPENGQLINRTAKCIGLLVLLCVPFAIYIAANPDIYPAVNPDTGGPTAASQLESSLMVVLILLLLPFGITNTKQNQARTIYFGWIVLAVESALCFALSRSDISHHLPSQYLSLGSLLVWLPLTPAYYAAFEWRHDTRHWRVAFLWWWGALVLTGWVYFLPGVLDHFKFTDGLVGHSFVAMAGFTSSLLIFVMIQLLGDDGWIFNRPRSFYLWHTGVVAYILAVTIAGWREGFEPAFTIVPAIARNILYIIRLITGMLMLLASLDWLVDSTSVLRKTAPVSIPVVQEETV